MSDRKSLTVQADAFSAADATRGDGESWSEWLERATAALETTDDAGGGPEHGPSTLPATQVDEIVRRTASRTADEVENRMTRR